MKNLWLYGAGLLLALLLALAACGTSGGGSGGSGGGGGGTTPDFTISLNPTSLTVQRGSRGITQLTITPQGGFTGTVYLSLGAPSGVTLFPTSVSVPRSSLRVTTYLSVQVDGGVAAGTYDLQVRATSGSLTKTASLSLTVTVPGGEGGGGGVGTTWTLRFHGFNDLNSVTYGNGLFVAVGDGGTILTSQDGVSWTQRTSGTYNTLSAGRRNPSFAKVRLCRCGAPTTKGRVPAQSAGTPTPAGPRVRLPRPTGDGAG